MFRARSIVQNNLEDMRMARRTKKAPVGRPPRHHGERLAKNRTFRIRGDLDERLQAAAKQAGRSVSEEIEHRLEGSFHVQDIHTASSIAAQTVMQRFMGKPKE
jgi:predicted DNA-binding protein